MIEIERMVKNSVVTLYDLIIEIADRFSIVW